jgi:hypothetical protein
MGIFGINPHIEMGNYDNYPYGNRDFGHPRFHIGKVQSLTRSRIISVTIWGLTEKIPKWKWFPYGDPHRHMEIPVWKWAGRKKNYHLGNPNYRILSATIWVLTYIPMLLSGLGQTVSIRTTQSPSTITSPIPYQRRSPLSWHKLTRYFIPSIVLFFIPG